MKIVTMKFSDCREGADIIHGAAVVKSFTYGGRLGWVLPGGTFTDCMYKAYQCAVEMNRLMVANGYRVRVARKAA